MIERDAHRIIKLSRKMDKVLMQLGTTNQKGNDATHFDLPSESPSSTTAASS